MNLSTLMEKLPPNARTPLLLGAVGVVAFVIIALFEGWFQTPKPTVTTKATPFQASTGPLGHDLEKDMLLELRHETAQLKRIITEQQQVIDELRDIPMQYRHEGRNGITIPGSVPEQPVSSHSPIPLPSTLTPTMSPPITTTQRAWIGGNSIVKNPAPPAKAEVAVVKERTIYLPSASFMRATLINGVNAKTSNEGSRDPQVVTLRIDDLTILPNDLKTNLKGCFALASAYGDLSDERVYLRLANLSCITHDGKGVIDQDIEGYVSDVDGQMGMAATVWAPFPDTLWRGMIISAFGGIGSFAAEAANPMTSSFNGTAMFTEQTSEPQLRDYLKGGIGSGIQDYTERLNDFYFDLIKQQGPSVMVKPGARVTVHFTHGVELKIRTVCGVGAEKPCES